MLFPPPIEGQDAVEYGRALAAALAESSRGDARVQQVAGASHVPAQGPNSLSPLTSPNLRPPKPDSDVPLQDTLCPSPAVLPESYSIAQLLEDLRTLATWWRLRDSTLADPIVGGHEHDPTGVSDRLGVKGLSVYTAFIDPESLQCRVCATRSDDLALALLHQRHTRHFQR